jgi:chromate transporter
LVIAVGALYAHYGDLPALRRMLTGIAASGVGLMLATVAKMARPLFKGPFKNPAVVAPLIALSTFVAIGVLCTGRCRSFCSRSFR